MRKAALWLAGLAWLGSAVPVAAHPHAWIDISVEVLFDASGRVTALRENWLFDEFYTAETVQKGERAKMDALTTRILRNLKEYGYFTRVEANGRPVALKVPVESSSRMEGIRLRMSFTALLAEPVAPASAPLTYAVFDPTYYIEMLHEETADAIRLVNAPPQCRFRMLPPQPDPKAVAVASALDRTQSGGDGLGAFFAEKVEVRCD
jgi:ABC-type uncharacterized transport system substrate-binding protein